MIYNTDCHPKTISPRVQPVDPRSGTVRPALLHQYFPKGSDLRVHQPEDLAAVAAELNDRPRKALGWSSLAERLEAFVRVGVG